MLKNRETNSSGGKVAPQKRDQSSNPRDPPAPGGRPPPSSWGRWAVTSGGDNRQRLGWARKRWLWGRRGGDAGKDKAKTTLTGQKESSPTSRFLPATAGPALCGISVLVFKQGRPRGQTLPTSTPDHIFAHPQPTYKPPGCRAELSQRAEHPEPPKCFLLPCNPPPRESRRRHKAGRKGLKKQKKEKFLRWPKLPPLKSQHLKLLVKIGLGNTKKKKRQVCF